MYIWGTNTFGNEGSRLVLEDSGELIVYSISGKAIWKSSDQNNSGNQVAARNFLELNQSLKLNDQITSANGEYHFIMQQDGNACVYKNKSTFVWGTMTHGKGATRLTFTKDGNLQVLTDKYVLIWGSGQTRTSAVKLVLENTGDLVSYDASGKVVWTSKSSGNASSSGSGKITELKTGDNFTSGQKMHCANGAYYFTLQSDGNLCIYNANNALTWSSWTAGSGATSCRIQDGYMQLYNAGGASIWSTASYWAAGSKCSKI
ncbi:MAG: hypothetical protein IPI60_18805 [Saprospiraceae bacterium]|nr:hypothetical protein [Saprospiraceae bacterium]